VTPLQKVLELLEGMSAKGKEAMHAEKVEFSAFSQWCESTKSETSKSIELATSQIVQLEADIEKAESDAEILAAEVEELESQLAAAQAEAQNATEIRKKEHADYAAMHADFSESLDAIARAIQVLRAKVADVPQAQAESLLQARDSLRLPARAKALIDAFIAEGSDASADGVPEANAYEFQSGGVVTILEKLEKKFQDQRFVLEKEELTAKSSFEMLMQRLTGTITTAEKSVAEKTAAKAGRLSDAASAKGDLEVTEASKVEDEKKLADTTAECEARSKEFEANQALRAQELQAISEAVEILSTDAVKGNAETYLPSMIQGGSRAVTSLAQLRGSFEGDVTALRQRVSSLLEKRGRALDSKYLMLVATHVSADPFVKVKKMIKELIVKLMEQANAEADHNAFCKTELATNKMTRENKQAEVEGLMAAVDEHTAKSVQLANEIADLSSAVAELQQQMAQATELRQEEKSTNTKTVADAAEAQVAVQKAIEVLKKFYGKTSDEAPSMIQSGATEAASEPYKGMMAESGGILGFLDVVLSDFARLEAETSAEEDAAQSSYDKFMAESKQDESVKQAEIDHKTSSKEQTDSSTAELKRDLEATQEELDAALDYYEKLKPDCVNTGLSYEKRVEMRKEEIESLKEALAILNQEDLA